MPDVSNLLRQRLGRGPGDGEAASPDSMLHPDADTLTAFVEQLLPSVERNSVVTHLSVCTLCREVVTLSLPQLPELAAQGQTALPVSNWRRFWTPGFRWAASAAAVAVAAALVVELPRQNQVTPPQGTQSETTRAAQEAKVAPAPEQPAVSGPGQSSSGQSSPGQGASDKSAAVGGLTSNTVTPSAPITEARITSLGRFAVKDTPQPRSLTFSTAGLSNKKEIAGTQLADAASTAVFIAGASGKQDYVNNDLFAANDANTSTSFSTNGSFSNNGASYRYDNFPPAPSPQPGNSLLGLAAAPPAQIANFSGIPANAKQKSKFLHILNPLTPVEHLGCILCKIVDSRHLTKPAPSSPAIAPGALAFSAMEVQGKFDPSLAKSQPTPLAAASEKSTSGDLDRSEAFTRRAAAAAAPASARLRESAAAQLHWRVADGKLFKSLDQNQWQDAYPRPDASFEFSFVTAHGADVWAGGSRAALLHSRDGGAMWENIKLGDSASGTIVGIVANGLNVQVKTSDNQTWASSDVGKTWALQSGQE